MRKGGRRSEVVRLGFTWFVEGRGINDGSQETKI